MSSKAQKDLDGAFVAVTAALLAVVIIVFGGMRFWQHRAEYKIVFDESVIGLEKGAQVYRNGIKVGRVKHIEVDPQDMSKVVVTIAIAEDTPVRTDTTAQLQYAGITGLKLIDLRGGTAEAPVLPEGGTIARGDTLLDKLSKKAEEIVDESQRIMERAYVVVDNLARVSDPAKYEAILSSARQTAANLEKASGQLDTMIAENRSAIRATVASVKETADTTRAIFQEQVTGLVGKATEVLADVRNLVRGSEGQLRSAVFDLRQASRNFKEMSRDVRARPSRLLFSSPPSERKLP
jgi:phospholipid/cholesterol/gamma-HCH transport system substrate-binding protein